ncbi:hypothetical protein AB0K92_08530 [Streptomyces sp. NPDC052687]|uniref:hypothetical protein n=1 Tax=Streptomyces sp. NPDC052687 TaxID=3154759 RepID=UPI00341CD62F
MRFVNALAASLAGIAAALLFGLAAQGPEAPTGGAVTANGGTAHVLIPAGDSGWQ